MTLEASYAWCRRIARARARNFYYSFLLLDRPRRDAMCAIYAFMRLCDDLSDGPERGTREAFDDWRRQMEAACDGRLPDHILWPAFHATVTHYGIPREYFHQMLDGVASDADFQRFETFDQLYRYCYRVASVVGLTVIHILGFRSEDALPLAEKCGVAFQLTNILRDVKEDYENGRIYLPAEDLARFGVGDGDLGAAQVSPALRGLLEFEAARARRYYQEALPLIEMVEPAGQPMLSALIETYSRLLARVEAADYEVLRRRVSLPLMEKWWILAWTALRGSRRKRARGRGSEALSEPRA
ncbi:MAG: phytoene/squalene synthase family protein [Acidobacteria bacterium]|nr:phytoene/squalene synthase family protein [Acidobacteriota bacterium]